MATLRSQSRSHRIQTRHNLPIEDSTANATNATRLIYQGMALCIIASLDSFSPILEPTEYLWCDLSLDRPRCCHKRLTWDLCLGNLND